MIKQLKYPRNKLVLNPIMRKGGKHKQKPDARANATRQALKEYAVITQW